MISILPFLKRREQFVQNRKTEKESNFPVVEFSPVLFKERRVRFDHHSFPARK